MNRGAMRRPLFPLDLVLLPTERLPVHVFEPRYKAMIHRCVEEEIPFGVVWAREGSNVDVGCWAAVETILRDYPDGRRDLLAIGGERFRIRSTSEHADGYLEVETEPVVDREPGDPEARSLLLELFSECRRLSLRRGAIPGDLTEDAPLEEDLLEPALGYTFRLAARIEMPSGEEQALLESESEARREQILLAHLAQLRPRLQVQIESLAKVRSNGRIHHA